MNSSSLPTVGTLVELTGSSDAPISDVNVVGSDGTVLTLSLALGDVPPVGTTVTVRWPAGPRGRYALEGTVATAGEDRVVVEAVGEPVIEQQRRFVRGGGGEPVTLRRLGQPDVPGWVRDISEQGVRAHFTDVDMVKDQKIRLRIELEDEVIDVEAVVWKVAGVRQTVPEPGPMSVEIVAVLNIAEAQAKIIRRYVMRHQLLRRTAPTG